MVLFYDICWVTYGVLITEFYVVFPSAIAIIFSLVEIIIYISYKTNGIKLEEEPELENFCPFEINGFDTSSITSLKNLLKK